MKVGDPTIAFEFGLVVLSAGEGDGCRSVEVNCLDKTKHLEREASLLDFNWRC